jgi:hypothetical protein
VTRSSGPDCTPNPLTQFYFNDEPEMRDQDGSVYRYRKTYDDVEITTNEIVVGLTQTVTVEAGTGSLADQVRVRLVEGEEPFCLTRSGDIAIWDSCDNPEEQASLYRAFGPHVLTDSWLSSRICSFSASSPFTTREVHQVVLS